MPGDEVSARYDDADAEYAARRRGRRLPPADPAEDGPGFLAGIVDKIKAKDSRTDALLRACEELATGGLRGEVVVEVSRDLMTDLQAKYGVPDASSSDACGIHVTTLSGVRLREAEPEIATMRGPVVGGVARMSPATLRRAEAAERARAAMTVARLLRESTAGAAGPVDSWTVRRFGTGGIAIEKIGDDDVMRYRRVSGPEVVLIEGIVLQVDRAKRLRPYVDEILTEELAAAVDVEVAKTIADAEARAATEEGGMARLLSPRR